MNSNLIIAIIGVGIAFGGFLFTYFGWIAGLYKAVGKLSGQIAILDKVDVIKLSQNVAAIEASLDSFWKMMDGPMRSLIKQPTHYRKDDLVDRFPNLNAEEMEELKCILQLEMIELRDQKDPKVLAFALMLARIDTVKQISKGE